MDTRPLKRARPHVLRAIVASLIALAGLVVARFGQLVDVHKKGHPDFDEATRGEQALAVAGAALLLLAGIAAVRWFARAAREAMEERTGDARGAPIGLVISAFGYLLLGLTVLSAVGVELEAFLLGGALTGVVIGIAAQQSLGNFFAGMVLLAVRPFSVGDRVVLRSGPLGGEYEGVVTNMRMFYVDMLTEKGPVALPNAGVLASAIGPGARSAGDTDELEDEG